MRKFEEVGKEFLKFPDVETKLPERATWCSAGYDFKSKENYVLKKGEQHLFWTDIKAAMFLDNVLKIYPRSGNAVKHGIVLANGTGIIDADYYNNGSNNGNIGICLKNTGEEDFEIKVDDRIAQGVFEKYYIVDDDKYLTKKECESCRAGGFGSTN